MNADTGTHFASDYSLTRIQVDKGQLKGEPSLTWNLRFMPFPDGIGILMGSLKSETAEGVGQAQVFAYLVPLVPTGEEEKLGPEPSFQWANEQAIRPLYDLAKRALESQAAAMDFSLDLPAHAPAAVIQRLDMGA